MSVKTLAILVLLAIVVTGAFVLSALVSPMSGNPDAPAYKLQAHWTQVASITPPYVVEKTRVNVSVDLKSWPQYLATSTVTPSPTATPDMQQAIEVQQGCLYEFASSDSILQVKIYDSSYVLRSNGTWDAMASLTWQLWKGGTSQTFNGQLVLNSPSSSLDYPSIRLFDEGVVQYSADGRYISLWIARGWSNISKPCNKQ